MASHHLKLTAGLSHDLHTGEFGTDDNEYIE
jgi:hypothetical protein